MPIQTRLPSMFAAVALACAAVAAPAQTLRWSSQGDPQTMDPYSQNEGLTNSFNGQVYEVLVARDKNLGLVPQLATEWKQESPTKWIFKLRRGSEGDEHGCEGGDERRLQTWRAGSRHRFLGGLGVGPQFDTAAR